MFHVPNDLFPDKILLFHRVPSESLTMIPLEAGTTLPQRRYSIF